MNILAPKQRTYSHTSLEAVYSSVTLSVRLFRLQAELRD